MTPSDPKTSGDARPPHGPSSPAPAQQRAADQKAAAKIDATEFWRRLGL